MGFTHYWRRSATLNREAFANVVEDARKILDHIDEMGIKMAGPTGEGKPEIFDSGIAFNGKKECGHPYRDLGKPWPAKTAEGVNATGNPIAEGEPWFSGPYLKARACGGCCKGGPFIVDRKFLVRIWDRAENGKYFCYCETDFKPYDLAVTAILIRLKERLLDEISVSSDGGEAAFEDARRLCRELFGWSKNFELEPQEKFSVVV